MGYNLFTFIEIASTWSKRMAESGNNIKSTQYKIMQYSIIDYSSRIHAVFELEKFAPGGDWEVSQGEKDCILTL
jgi:hypothetical protein